MQFIPSLKSRFISQSLQKKSQNFKKNGAQQSTTGRQTYREKGVFLPRIKNVDYRRRNNLVQGGYASHHPKGAYLIFKRKYKFFWRNYK